MTNEHINRINEVQAYFKRTGEELPDSYKHLGSNGNGNGAAELSQTPEFHFYRQDKARNEPEPETALDGIVRRNDVLCVVGGSKSAKTWMALQMAISAVHGIPWLGRDMDPGDVLYINFELRQADLDKRILRIEEAMGLKDSKHRLMSWNLKGVNIPSALMLLAELNQRVGPGQYRWIIIDPLYRLLGAFDSNSENQMGQLMATLERMPMDLDTNLIITDHTPKGDVSDREVIDLMSGSSTKGRAVDAVLAIRRHAETSIEQDLYCLEASVRHFQRFEPITAEFVYPQWELKTDMEAERLKPGERRHRSGAEHVLDAVRNHSRYADIINHLALTHSKSEKTVKRWFSEAVKLNLIDQLDDKSWTLCNV